jgi:hypothetical protein
MTIVFVATPSKFLYIVNALHRSQLLGTEPHVQLQKRKEKIVDDGNPKN